MHPQLHSVGSHVEHTLQKKASEKVLQKVSFPQPLASWRTIPHGPLSVPCNRYVKAQMASMQTPGLQGPKEHSNLADLLGPSASTTGLCGALASERELQVQGHGTAAEVSSWRRGQAHAEQMSGCSWQRGGARSAFWQVPEGAEWWSRRFRQHRDDFSRSPSSTLASATPPSDEATPP